MPLKAQNKTGQGHPQPQLGKRSYLQQVVIEQPASVGRAEAERNPLAQRVLVDQAWPRMVQMSFSPRAKPFHGAGLTPGRSAQRQTGSWVQQVGRRLAPGKVLASREHHHLLLGSKQGWGGAQDCREQWWERRNPPFSQGSPVFLGQCGNEAMVHSARIAALALLRDRWFFLREEQLGLHNGLQLSRII